MSTKLAQLLRKKKDKESPGDKYYRPDPELHVARRYLEEYAVISLTEECRRCCVRNFLAICANTLSGSADDA